ncbi:hypothetical protein [Saccharospirillum salsuginis]|uniref:Uncharacterized protein n=1 Tax=Saccharospirillum salsuginis TaxID=418750 RepID=A0A918NJ45_9GAMM|nr:hypothetical protein [Saccharospirillum salsuginis]GGX71058.1 hypothetical protein GCM10007392_43170 [Saccharospirillum salsuginis]
MSSTTSADPDLQLKPWWLPIPLTEDTPWHGAIGPLSIYLERGQHEWRLAWEHRPDVIDNNRLELGTDRLPPDTLDTGRYVFRQAPSTVRLRPRLLDRPTVVKTNEPVMIPPGEQSTFYISSPVCVCIECDALEKPLLEIPTVQLSDTWFGPNTREGELCYAARTSARNDVDDVPLRPHRAVTPVLLHNRSTELLAIEKLSIPLPMLSVFGRDDGTLWTESVSLEHHASDSLASLKIGRKPDGATLLSEARLPSQRNNVVRAFINLFTD